MPRATRNYIEVTRFSFSGYPTGNFKMIKFLNTYIFTLSNFLISLLTVRVIKLDHHCFRHCLVTCVAPTQYIKETYLIITIGPLETNYSENFNPNYNTFHSRNFFGKRHQQNVKSLIHFFVAPIHHTCQLQGSFCICAQCNAISHWLGAYTEWSLNLCLPLII